jgi:hypothetical protein
VLYVGNSGSQTSFVHNPNYKSCWNAMEINSVYKQAYGDLSSQFARLLWEIVTHQNAFVTLSWRIPVQ